MCAGPGVNKGRSPVERGRWRVDMGESDRAPIELILWGWGREEWGDGLGSASRALVRRLGAVGVWAGDASGLAVVRYGETSLRRRSPTGTPPGRWLRC